MKSVSNDASGRMFTYLWFDERSPNECKYGETFVYHGQDPWIECGNRTRDSLAVNKHYYDNGTVKMVRIWDVSDYATKNGKNYTHAGVDNVIRKQLPGCRRVNTTEIHEIPWYEFVTLMDDFMIQQTQPLPQVYLTTKQYESLHDSLHAIHAGKRTIAANLCARFGKTIWAGALIREMDKNVNVVCSYVLSSFTSFVNDLRRFEQFRDIEMIDSSKDDWRDRFEMARNHNKKLVVFVSLCPGSVRQDRIDHVFAASSDKLIIVDEADFGAHKRNQFDILNNNRTQDDTVVLMTGTNIERATSGWEVDHLLSVTYPELLFSKANPIQASKSPHIKYFQEDAALNNRYVEMEMYQMALIELLDDMKKQDPGMFVENGEYLPSWSKTAADPIRAKGFIVKLFQSLFHGDHDMDQLNVDFQTSMTGSSVSMVFLPGSTKNTAMNNFTKILQEALPNFEVVEISGNETTNKNAETSVKNRIIEAGKKNKSVLLLSAGMASRSFSIPQIDKIFLAYDRGESGPTIQKLSRALTPSAQQKTARIFSLSFDPNRDDKFDSVIMETAKNIKERNGLSFPIALEMVLRTMNIFKCTVDGRLKFNPSDYLLDMLENDRIDRTIAQRIVLNDINFIKELANGKASTLKVEKQAVAQMGKTHRHAKNQSEKTTMSDQQLDELKKAKEQIAKIVRRIDVIWKWPTLKEITNVEQAFELMDQDTKLQKCIGDFYEISYEIIKQVVCNLIDRDMLMVKLSRINT